MDSTKVTLHQQGFSLVEALVAMIISTIIVGLAITFLIMNDREVKDGSANSFLQMQYETVVGEIGDTIRSAFRVFDGEVPEPWEDDPAKAEAETKIIHVYDTRGQGMVGYRINTTVSQIVILEHDGTDWDSVGVVTGGRDDVVLADAENCYFRLSSHRNMVTLFLSLKLTMWGNDYVVSPRGDEFRCRNEVYD